MSVVCVGEHLFRERAPLTSSKVPNRWLQLKHMPEHKYLENTAHTEELSAPARGIFPDGVRFTDQTLSTLTSLSALDLHLKAPWLECIRWQCLKCVR